MARPDTKPVDGARVVVNPSPERGMRSSLLLGLAAAGGEAVAVLLVDTPGIEADAVATVVSHWRAESTASESGFTGEAIGTDAGVEPV